MLNPKTSEYVTSWDVKQYIYCPTIVWIKSVVGVEEPADINMELGKSREYGRTALNSLSLPRPLRFEVWVRNPSAGLAGVVDVLAGDGRFEVAEVKAYERRGFEHFRLQLMFYSYLVTVSLGPVTKAHLVLGRSYRTYPITERSLTEVSRLVRKVRQVRDLERPPPSPYARSSRCLRCWYRRYCPWL